MINRSLIFETLNKYFTYTDIHTLPFYTIHTLTFLVSKMRWTNLEAQLVSILRAKLLKVVMKFQDVFLSFGPIFSKCTFWGCSIFFSPYTYPVKSVLSALVGMLKIDVLDEVFYPLCYYCYDVNWNCVISIATTVRVTNPFNPIMQLINNFNPTF